MAFSPGPTLMAGIFFATVVAVMILLGWFMSPVIIPLLLASILYVLLEPVVSLLQRKGMGRLPAIALALFSLLAVAGLLAAVVMPVLAEQLILLRERLPGAWANLSGHIVRLERTVTSGIGMERSGSSPSSREPTPGSTP